MPAGARAGLRGVRDRAAAGARRAGAAQRGPERDGGSRWSRATCWTRRPRCVGRQFAHVITNPPYAEAGGGPVSPDPQRGRAHAGADTAAWIDACLKRLEPGGRLTVIHRADRLGTLLAAIEGRAGDVAVLPLWPRAGEAARRVILRRPQGLAGAAAASARPGAARGGRPLHACGRRGAARRRAACARRLSGPHGGPHGDKAQAPGPARLLAQEGHGRAGPAALGRDRLHAAARRRADAELARAADRGPVRAQGRAGGRPAAQQPGRLPGPVLADRATHPGAGRGEEAAGLRLRRGRGGLGRLLARLRRRRDLRRPGLDRRLDRCGERRLRLPERAGPARRRAAGPHHRRPQGAARPVPSRAPRGPGAAAARSRATSSAASSPGCGAGAAPG